MKNMKIIVPAALLISLGISWTACLGSGVKTYKTYRHHMEFAHESSEGGLYEQAIEEYKEALKYWKSEGIWQEILRNYELLYGENHSAYVRKCYLDDMVLASEDYPGQAVYWKAQLDLYLEEMNYSKAYEIAKAAMKVPVKDEEVKSIYEDLLYRVKTDYELYSDFRTCLNGYISVYDGNQWKVLDEEGKTLTGNYAMIGLINDEGKGIYRDDTATWLLDKKEVARGRFDLEIEDAGYYSESLDCVPVKIGGVWKYLKGDGTFLPGEYERAGSFYNGRAAVQKGEAWYLIDTEGLRISDRNFEDIKLDLYGCHQQGDVILAKENGMYHIYNEKLEQVGDFSSDEIDICIDGGLIAYRQGNAWGYVNTKGEVVIEPTYGGAKSFSYGMAAVQNKDGLWGFINREYKIVIDPIYLDAHYFTSEETCMVSGTENTYQMQHYQFE
ncbi:WG repeat-containing protein [Anaerostipes sp.]|uniref:WG repeat-containing protein n=1 Tax=Anaerostipes sp. TaxID=1872530 RepID=UPI0025898451|nr:WG repeat-containing protein [Anaerostipes sp.]MCI5623053.1 WG repeat-containing protein [Anaerostipes sp.]